MNRYLGENAGASREEEALELMRHIAAQPDQFGRLPYGTVPYGEMIGKPIVRDGRNWVQAGGNYENFAKQHGEILNQSGIRPEHFTYDPQYGYLVPEEVQAALAPAIGKSMTDNSGLMGGIGSFLDKGGGVMALGLGGMAAGLGGLFPGIDAAGTAIPAGQSGILSQLGLQNPFGSLPQTPSTTTPGDASWGVNQLNANPGYNMGRSLYDMGMGSDLTASQLANFTNPIPGPTSSGMTGTDLSNFANPQNTMQMSIPGISTPGLGATASGLSGLGSFFGDMLTPKNMLNAGGQLASSLLQHGAINKAVDAQTGAADRATAATLAMYNQNREDLAPWRTAGSGAVGRLSNMLTPGNQFTAMQADPGYQFRLDEGTKAIDRSAAARGKLFSPGTQNAVQRYGQNFASNEFGNVANRLSNLAGLGQTATNTTAALGANAANQQGQNLIGAGNARASGYVGSANAFSGGISNFLRNMQEEELLRALLTR